MIGEFVSNTINSMSADMLVSMLGLSSKDSKVLKSKYNPNSNTRPIVGSYASRKIKTEIPSLSVWQHINKTVILKENDLEQLIGFKSFLQLKGLVAPDTKTSILDLKPGEINMFHQIRNKIIKSTLKYSLLDKGDVSKFKTPSDGILIMSVAGGPVEFDNFTNYKNELLNSIGINDTFIDTIKDKVTLKEVASKMVDSIDDDEFLNGLF